MSDSCTQVDARYPAIRRTHAYARADLLELRLRSYVSQFRSFVQTNIAYRCFEELD